MGTAVWLHDDGGVIYHKPNGYLGYAYPTSPISERVMRAKNRREVRKAMDYFASSSSGWKNENLEKHLKEKLAQPGWKLVS